MDCVGVSSPSPQPSPIRERGPELKIASIAEHRLSAGAIRDHLHTAWLGREIVCRDEVDSTNVLARDLARAGAAQGTVVIAESQTAGRGRLGRGWISPPGKNLYLSIVLRPALAPERVAQLTLVAGVAACEAVRGWCPEARIKWPNDVLVGGRKVVGILCEMEYDAAPLVIAGIGVNLNAAVEDFPPDLRDKAGSLATALGHAVDRARFTAELLARLEAWLDGFAARGFADVAAAWERLSGMVGEEVRIAHGGGVVAGRVLGLDDDGALRVVTSSGVEERVVAGDVTVVGGYDKKGLGPEG